MKRSLTNDELSFKMNEEWVINNQNVSYFRFYLPPDALLGINNRFQFEFDVILGDNNPLDPAIPIIESGFTTITFIKTPLPLRIKLTKPALKKILKEANLLDRLNEVSLLLESYELLVKNAIKCQEENADVKKKDFKMPVYAGATGIGKTELLQTAEKIFNNKQYFDALPVFITFNSAFPYTAAEDQYSIEQAVNARIACALGAYKGPGALRRALESKVTFEQVFPTPPKVIVLLVDEFNVLAAFDNKLTDFVIYCGHLMTPVPDKPIVIVITAGTLPAKINEIFTESKCPGTLVPISALKMQSMIKDLRANKSHLLKEMYKVLQDICGIPRLYITLKDQSVLPDTYDEAIGIIRAQSTIPKQPPPAVLNVVVPYSLLELPVLKDTAIWDEYISKGQAFLYPFTTIKSLVKFPMYWLSTDDEYYKQIKSPVIRIYVKKLYWMQTVTMTGHWFEEMASMWLALRTWLFSQIFDKLPSVKFSDYMGIEMDPDLDFDISVNTTQLYGTTSKATSKGFANLYHYLTKEPVVLSDIPFIINCCLNQDGIDCIKAFLDSLGRLILVFYQFKCYSQRPADAAKELVGSLDKSVAVISNVKVWIKKTFNKDIHRCFYLAVVNYCNDPIIPNNFQKLIDDGLEYHFVQGPKCKRLMSHIICERNSIWTRDDALLMNIAPLEAIKMLPNIGDAVAERIINARELGQFESVSDLINKVGKLTAKQKDAIKRYSII